MEPEARSRHIDRYLMLEWAIVQVGVPRYLDKLLRPKGCKAQKPWGGGRVVAPVREWSESQRLCRVGP